MTGRKGKKFPAQAEWGTRRVLWGDRRVDAYVYTHEGTGNTRHTEESWLHNNAKPQNADEYGLKLFRRKEEAYGAWTRQVLAENAGLAPPTGSPVVLADTTGKTTLWGYRTGRADTTSLAEFHGRSVEKNARFHTLIKNLRALRVPCTQDIVDYYGECSLARMGGDLHGENIGIWGGKAVFIDYGVHSVRIIR